MEEKIIEKRNHPKRPQRCSVVFLLIILLVLQILDFFFTYIGVLIHGIKAEGNPIVYYLMELFGPLVGLSIIKCSAIFLILILFYISSKKPTSRVLYFLLILNLTYLAAVGSWIYVFYL
jgi:hypothetical protein